MKAIPVHAYGQPPRLDDVPEPEATGPDDVVVRIGGAGLCRTDLHCGADQVVAADGRQAQHVRDLTDGGADAVFDFVGEDSTIGDSVGMLRSGGTYYLVGYAARRRSPACSSCWAVLTPG